MAAESKSITNWFALLMHAVPGGTLIFALIPLVVCGYLGWYHYGARKLDQALYSLQLPQIQVTAQPPWIKTSVLEDVFQSKGLDRINLLDPSASATIAGAFETHPWIEKTVRVRKKQGGSVDVDVIYRKPLAMVKVYYYQTDANGQRSSKRKEGFFPVDAKGVILPESDFKQNQAMLLDYLMIDIDQLEHPNAQPGMPFNDIRVMEALKLIAYLESKSDPKQLGLQWVHVRADSRPTSVNPWLFELWTTDKHLIIWGHAPGEESGSEASAENKLIESTKWLDEQRANSATRGTLTLFQDTESQKSLPVSTQKQ
jgi:hypothetical protein